MTKRITTIDNIKHKIPFDELFRELFPDHYKGISSFCPFHEDSRNSFEVHEDHGFCHAGCRPKNGSKSFDVISLWMLAKGADFKTAVKELDERHGVDSAINDKPVSSNHATRQREKRTESGPKAKSRIVATYDYSDESGNLLFQTVKYEPKEFKQRRPDGKGGWAWNLKDTRRVLYRLPAVIQADTVLICEGEKDVDNLAALRLCGTSAPMGAGKWDKVCLDGRAPDALRSKHVIICPDNDKPGREHGQAVAHSLHGFAASVKILELPGLPEKGDVSDFIENHGPDEAKRLLVELAEKATEYLPGPEKKKPPKEEKAEKPTRFRKLFDAYSETGADAFLDEQNVGWVCLRVNGVPQNVKINSAKFKRHMVRIYWQKYAESPGREAISDLGDLLEASATEIRKLYNRFAWVDGKLYIDMCNAAGEAIEVTSAGWKEVQLEKPLFRPYSHQQPFPEPETGGKVSDILPFFPTKREGDRVLLQVWVAAAFLEHIPRSGIIIHGDKGSGKSNATKRLRAIVDPSLAEVISLPQDHDEFSQALSHHALMTLDNIKHLSEWMSTDLCTAITAGWHTKRKLYTDEDDILFSIKRTWVLNGIEVPSTGRSGIAPDLLDRSILLELIRIEKADCIEEETLLADFEKARPRIFGAILDALSKAIAIRPSVKLAGRLPRMADFGAWGYALAEAMGIGGEEFLKAFYHSIEDQNEEIVGSHPVSMTLMDFMADRTAWSGKPAELYTALKAVAKATELVDDKNWPKAVNTFSKKLKALSTNLKEVGFLVTTGIRETDSGRGRKILIRKVNSNSESLAADIPISQKTEPINNDPQEALDLKAPDAESHFECSECGENRDGVCNLCGQAIDDSRLCCPMGIV